MSQPLEGMHYCMVHQSNYSHYSAENCAVCRLLNEIANLKEAAILKEHHYTVMKVSAEVLAQRVDDLTRQLAAKET